MVYKPDLLGSPFSTRVWIPLTPDVPAPAPVGVSASISVGVRRLEDDTSWPSLIWDTPRRIATTVAKIILLRLIAPSFEWAAFRIGPLDGSVSRTLRSQAGEATRYWGAGLTAQLQMARARERARILQKIK